MKFSIFIMIFILCLSFKVYAEDVIQGSDTGGINWTKGTVFASGYGVAGDKVPSRKKRLLARRAAQVDAYRNLAEILSGVRVSSETTIKDLEAHSDIIKTKLNAVIKGALITKDIYQNEVAQIVIEVKMDGTLIETISNKKNQPGKTSYINNISFFISHLLSPSNWHTLNKAYASDLPNSDNSLDISTFLRKLQEKIKNEPKESAIEYIKTKLDSFESKQSYSGLLVDAKNISEFELATIPKLRTKDGKVIYPTTEMLNSEAFKKRPVSYDFNVTNAVENKRVAYSPYIVKAIGTYKSRNSDLVVSDDVALFIKSNAYISKTLDKASVMIVVAQ
ncbi:LPP20 family lipoprotein [Pseudoalteromonas denitrificans]|uniref:LPP20 lipoprotein n=1 Tax=Pseudoalteromonas denitrificans DSM 6059 TaxID=1123010 RepID=A0A1I1FGW1_9GAMM|nr:LPP20 family lipoprotein [Pseudoalteromonas denitrificans]SFB98647.1 LPP20 lipoprotein [Pseudoalteromonas denitrificans DSM 6059]